MNKEKVKGILKSKIVIVGICSFMAGGMFMADSGIDTTTHDGVLAEVETLKGEKAELEEKITTLEGKVAEAKPYFDMKEEERVAMEEEAKAKEAERVAAEEEKKKQEEAAKLEEEKKGYDTGITYDNLARTPDEYIGKKVKFSGKVVQVMEGNGEVQVRLAVNGDYDNILFVAWKDGLTEQRVLEDDNITVSGLSGGILTYKSTMGGDISIPQVLAMIVE